jgi:hypothetical protein
MNNTIIYSPTQSTSKRLKTSQQSPQVLTVVSLQKDKTTSSTQSSQSSEEIFPFVDFGHLEAPSNDSLVLVQKFNKTSVTCSTCSSTNNDDLNEDDDREQEIELCDCYSLTSNESNCFTNIPLSFLSDSKEKDAIRLSKQIEDWTRHLNSMIASINTMKRSLDELNIEVT